MIAILLIAGVALFVAVSAGALLAPCADTFTADLPGDQRFYLAD